MNCKMVTWFSLGAGYRRPRFWMWFIMFYFGNTVVSSVKSLDIKNASYWHLQWYSLCISFTALSSCTIICCVGRFRLLLEETFVMFYLQGHTWMLMWLSFGSLGVEVVTCQHFQCYSCYHLLHQITVDLPVIFSVRPFQTYIGRVTSHIRQYNHRFFHLFCLCEKVCLMSWDLCTFCTLSFYLFVQCRLSDDYREATLCKIA